jgi:ferrous iron transport protein A
LKVTFSRTLAEIAIGVSAQVGAVGLDADVSAWLAAVGIAAGESVVVLRRGAFGGPIHVRTGSGGEFAVARTLARSIMLAEAVSASEKTE